MADHHAVAHASPDDEYLETPAGSEYEHTDANVWIIVKFLVWLVISAVVIHFGLGLMYGFLIEQSKETGDRRYPMAAPADERRLPATPRLQQFPQNERYVFRQGEEELLNHYGWMNKNAGTVHIPIADAMRLLVERGLPARAQDPALPVETPGMMPSDSSSGRVMERRRQ
jgi:hypothetical protein